MSLFESYLASSTFVFYFQAAKDNPSTGSPILVYLFFLQLNVPRLSLDHKKSFGILWIKTEKSGLERSPHEELYKITKLITRKE